MLTCRDAEDKLEQSQKTVVEGESVLQRYKKDCENLKIELIERNEQEKRCVLSITKKLNIK